MLAKVKEYFATLSPGTKKAIVLGALGTTFLGVITAAVILSESGDTKKPISTKPKKEKKVNYDVFTGVDTKNLSGDALAAKVKLLEEEIKQMREKKANPQVDMRGKGDRSGIPDTDKMNAAGDDAAKGGPDQFLPTKSDGAIDTSKPAVDTRDAELIEKIKRQQEQKRAQQSTNVTKTTTPVKTAKKTLAPTLDEDKEDPLETIAKNSGPTGGAVTSGPAPAAQGGSKIMVYDEESQARKPPMASGSQPGSANAPVNSSGGKVPAKGNSNKKDKPDLTLPAGSIISGTIITGMDAPTSAQSRRDPFPALLRIKADAVLPNRFRMDIKECFIISAGYGDMASERAYLRAEALSCVTQDGEIIESGLDAYAVGEDGKTGVRGRLVSKSGSILARSLMTGFLGGITNALKPARIPTISLTPGANIETQRPSADQILEESVLGGVSAAASEISKYYIEMARSIFPVIEVDAGRNIDFIVTRSAKLSAKGKQGGTGRQGGMGQFLGDATRGASNLMNGGPGSFTGNGQTGFGADQHLNGQPSNNNRFFTNPISR